MSDQSSYTYQEFPKCKYHRTGKTVTVKDAEEEAALGEGWSSLPGPYRLSDNADPCGWLLAEEIPGLTPEAKNRIGAVLWEAHAFIHEASADQGTEARLSAMKKAFDAIAHQYFDAGQLNRSLMVSTIPALVYDAAVSGGWQTGSPDRNRRCAYQLGHYWVPPETPGTLKELFQAQIFRWEATLMKTSNDSRRNLNPDEFSVLAILSEAFPEKLHLHQLAPRTAFPEDRAKLLKVVDGLITRRFVECVPLRGSDGLADAADILISDSGAALLSQLRDEAKSAPQSAAPKPTLMPGQAVVLKVLIAAPSDVTAERDAIVSAIHEWNANHTDREAVTLQPVQWKTHSYPEAGDRPQALLNKQIVNSGHFLIGIFGHRLGTPTGKAPSGTLEEIEEFRKTGRHIALYFSNAPFPRDVDFTQAQAVRAYQKERENDALYFTFSTPDELRRLATQHLPRIVSAVTQNLASYPSAAPSALSSRVSSSARVAEPGPINRGTTTRDLSPMEIELLWNAAKSHSVGQIEHTVTLAGDVLRANGRQFLDGADARTAAEWIGALNHLEQRGFIRPLGSEREIFRVTAEGYRAADGLQDFVRWDVNQCVLRARFLNAPTQEHRIACKGIVAIPALYREDDVAADGGVMRNLKEARSLLIEKVSPMPPQSWQPNEIEFVDAATGGTEIFSIGDSRVVPPDSLKLALGR